MPLRNPYDLSERDQRLVAKQPDALKVLLRSCARGAFATLLHSRVDAFPAGRLEFASAPSANASGERSDVLAARSGGDLNCEMLIPEEAAPQFRDDAAPRNGMMPPPDSEMIAPPITE